MIDRLTLAERTVIDALASAILIPADRIRPTDHLFDDLDADGDDLAGLFVPDVERALGIKVPVRAWDGVQTVQDIVDVVARVLAEQRPG